MKPGMRRSLGFTAILVAFGVVTAIVSVQLITMPSDESPAAGGVSRLPPFEGVTAWLNTSVPLTPEHLRGRVILIVFWAYSDSDTLRALPIIQSWDARYRRHGLEVIGIHTPQFSFERSVANVQLAVERLGIRFPVAVDGDRRLWVAYRNQEWPAYYVADCAGRLVGFQFGTGREVEVERYLRGLLADSGYPPPGPDPARPPPQASTTWTLPWGMHPPWGSWFVSPETPVLDEPRAYTVPPAMPLNSAALDGVWQFEEERVRVVGPRGRLVAHTVAPRCAVVLGGPSGVELDVRLDGQPVPSLLRGADLIMRDHLSFVRLDQPRLYHLIEPGEGALDPAAEHTLEVIVPRDVAVYTCTFN